METHYLNIVLYVVLDRMILTVVVMIIRASDSHLALLSCLGHCCTTKVGATKSINKTSRTLSKFEAYLHHNGDGSKRDVEASKVPV